MTETLPTPDRGTLAPPSLPGPKPRDYRFTTRSDSVFIFTVSKDIPDRQHAFYVYAVDNQGKPDATPARFIFNSIDEFPPIPMFLPFPATKAIGTVYVFDQNGELVPQEKTWPITDQDIKGTLPRDTVAANATLIFQWSSQVRIAGSRVTGYRYKLDEPDFVRVPATVTQRRSSAMMRASSSRVENGLVI